MTDTHDETIAWCEQAEAALRDPPTGCVECVRLARQGVLLRRHWDLSDPNSPDRRAILRILPTVQNIAQRRFAECVRRTKTATEDVIQVVVDQLVEDDENLLDLLNNHTLSAESAAFAVECFRDDLHWLGTQVAVLDGSRGIDFLGRILLEQESIQREMDSMGDDGLSSRQKSRTIFRGAEKSRSRSESTDATENEAAMLAELQPVARMLRTTALARQVQSLLDEPDPDDLSGWFRTWQMASQLATRLEGGTDPETTDDIDPFHQVQSIRTRAIDQWTQGLSTSNEVDRIAAIQEASQALGDAASESLTFLEDLSLSQAVQNLEVLEEDVSTCHRVTRNHPGTELQNEHSSLSRSKGLLRGELQERRLTFRMERLFGRRFVAGLERFILVLLSLFVVMLAVEGPLLRYESEQLGLAEVRIQDSWVVPIFAWLDLGICIVFLAELTLKTSLTRRRLLYLRRNFVTGLVPAIPIGFLFYMIHNLELAEEAEWFVMLRFLRYLRLPRMVRWFRIARPILRVLRLIGFLIRASDRLVRQLTPLLNRNLVLFERAAVIVREPAYRGLLAALRERFYYRATELIAELPAAARCQLAKSRIDDLNAMLSAPRTHHVIADAVREGTAVREIPLERIIARLLSATPAGISDRIGRGLAHSVTRWCRVFDIFLVRRLPVFRDLVAAHRLPSPYDTTALVANRIGQLLSQILDRVYWMADLYGTLTAPQLVDSMGQYMVKRTLRPAKRLVMIGVAFLVVSYLVNFIPFLVGPAITLRRLFGTPLIVLGLICMLPLLLGLWFRRIAGEASGFYNHVAEAQFLSATKRLKQGLTQQYHAILHRRAIAPEALVSKEGEDAKVLEGVVDLLWKDYLDGAPFHHSDTRASNQLLGNLMLVSLRETRLRFDRYHRAMLRRLDLSNERISLRGPYLWSHFISRSLAQHTAKLVADYDAHALALSRAEVARDTDVYRYFKWLSRRLGRPVRLTELAPAFRQRQEQLLKSANVWRPKKNPRRFQTNDFTAIHFLSAEPEVEADIRRRYGDLVADLMHRDRCDNIRRVFRTYPFHEWPREDRTFNPLTLHQQHVAGGRIFLLPLKFGWWSIRMAIQGVRLSWSILHDVLNPKVGDISSLRDSDPFEVAERKIHRMRKPIFLECLRMRAAFDPEYLGCIVPGVRNDQRNSNVAEIDEDLLSISADLSARREFRQLAARRRRQILHFRRLMRRLGILSTSPSAESFRAMTIAYTIDYRGMRSRLDAFRLIEEALEEVTDEPTLGRSRWSPSAWWCRWRNRNRVDRLFGQATFADTTLPHQAAFLKIVSRRRGELLMAVQQLTDGISHTGDITEDARRLYTAVARDPAPWTRQLVTLRAVQTLSLLDLKTYCDLVAELGEYEILPTLVNPDDPEIR